MTALTMVQRGAISVMLALLVLWLSDPTEVSAAQISQSYEFAAPRLESVAIGNQSYDRLVMPLAPNGGHPGEPALPERGATILLPPGATVTKIDVIAGEPVPLGAGFLIEPVGYPHPLSTTPAQTSLPTPDPLVYNLTSAFPERPLVEIGTQEFRGYRMLIVRLRPVVYVPATGELSYYRSLTLVVDTEDSGRASGLFRAFTADQDEIRCRVDNAEWLTDYPPITKIEDRDYDLLILTTDDLAAAFQPLKDYHDTTGTPTEIHTITEVGSSDPDAVRDYVRERYLNDGISYLLIGADDDQIPAKDLYVDFWDEGGHYEEYDMPADHYFGCLDGPYDYDGDGLAGESNDGADGNDVDLVAEVYVGRITADTPLEVNTMIDKTLGYLTTSEPYLQDVVLAGEYLSFSGLGEYGAYSMDQLVDASEGDAYATFGFPSTTTNLDKLYDRDYAGNFWPASAIADRINTGRHIVNHYGHCNSSYAMKITSNQIPYLFTNTRHCFIYSQGCMAGWLDDYDGWVERATVKTVYGAFAAVMNARYGLGGYGTDGPSHRFNREFWDAVFNPVESRPELGRANHDSREDNIYRIDEEGMRWCFYELNLFGDPTIKFRFEPSLTLGFPEGTPEILRPGLAQDFPVEVTSVCAGDLVSGSVQLHYSINGAPYEVQTADAILGDRFLAALPACECGDEVSFYVSAEEATQGRLYYPDSATPLTAIVSDRRVSVFADDFESDRGWTVSGGLWERGVPTGGGGLYHQYGGADPTSGCVGPNVYGYNLNGDYTNSMPERHLTSPAIDCSAFSGMHLRLQRWLGVQQPSCDHAYIRISTNGTDWTTVWQNQMMIRDNVWMPQQFDISDLADGQPTVYVRITMGVTSPTTACCGWNVDDFELFALECLDATCGDADSNELVNISDAVYLIAYIFSGGAAPEPFLIGDVDCNLLVNISDAVFLISYIFAGGPAPCADCR